VHLYSQLKSFLFAQASWLFYFFSFHILLGTLVVFRALASP